MSIHHKCNVNFQSKWAFIEGRKIHVEQYIPSNENEIKCNDGHELVFCNGKKREKYYLILHGIASSNIVLK